MTERAILRNSPVLRRLTLTHFLLELQFWFPVWLLFLTERGFDLTTIVLADGVFRLTMVVFEVPLGILGDRIGHKRAYLLVTMLAVATYFGIAIVETVPMLFVVWILWGIFWAMSSGTASAYAYELTVQEGYGDQSLAVFGTLRAVTNFAALVSHLAAGFLFTIWQSSPFVISAVLALLATLIVLTLPDTSKAQDHETQHQANLSDFFDFLDQTKSVRITVVLLALALIYYWSPRILMQPLFIELQLAPIIISTVYFAYSLAGIMGSLFTSRINQIVNSQRTALSGMFIIWIGIMLIALLPGNWALICFPLLSFGYYLTHTILEVSLHQKVKTLDRATILSSVSFIGGVAILFARPALGLLADYFSASSAFGIWAIIGIGVLSLFIILREKVDFQ